MKKFLNKTILFQSHLAADDGRILSGTVEQISESGKYVRIDWSWFSVEKISVLEEVKIPKPVLPMPPVERVLVQAPQPVVEPPVVAPEQLALAPEEPKVIA
jgi:hypothetical protein